MIHEIATLLEPWKTRYSDSTAISSSVTGVHILALVMSGGMAIAADRTTLRALRASPEDRRVLLRELHFVHRPVVIGLVFLFASGLLQMTADFETFMSSPLFWVKMFLVAALLVNGTVLYLTDRRLNDVGATDEAPRSIWRRLRASTWISLGLWITITIAGAILPATA